MSHRLRTLIVRRPRNDLGQFDGGNIEGVRTAVQLLNGVLEESGWSAFGTEELLAGPGRLPTPPRIADMYEVA